MSEIRASSFSKDQYEKARAEPNMQLVHLTIREPHTMTSVTISGPMSADIAQNILKVYLQHLKKGGNET